MAGIDGLSQALLERARPELPAWSTFWFEPSPIPVPAVCVRPDQSKFVDMQQVMGVYAKWPLRLAFYAPANDQEGPRLDMGPLTDPTGPLIRRLLSDDIDDDLQRMCQGNVWVTTGRGWDVIRRNRQRYLYADIGVVLGANGA